MRPWNEAKRHPAPGRKLKIFDTRRRLWFLSRPDLKMKNVFKHEPGTAMNAGLMSIWRRATAPAGRGGGIF
jgi:hypothetical protein